MRLRLQYANLKNETSAEAERPVPLKKAGRFFANEGWEPSLATLWRWMQCGIIGRNGDRVRLRYHMIGNRRFIALSAARDFIAACNAMPQESATCRPGAAAKALESLGC